MCPNLKNLTLVGCKVTGSPVLTICHPRLSNLTIDKGNFSTPTVNMVAPRLKNLTILRYNGKFRVSTPKLASLLLRGSYPSMFSSDGFPCLEKAIIFLQSADASITFLRRLNSSVELISHQPSPLANLKSLKILPKIYVRPEDKHKRFVVSTEVKNYLLSRSPKATMFTPTCLVSVHIFISDL
ncbi:putative leucine-rich repeat domain superfamily [Helianthus anomalus]